MRVRFSDIGHCIYCGSTNEPLTREHVIPRGLGGQFAPEGYHEAIVLQKATCEPCRNITQKLEEECQQKMMGHFRSVMGLRSKDSQSDTAKVKVVLATGETEIREVAVTDLLPVLLLPVYGRAGILQGWEIRQSYIGRLTTTWPVGRPKFLKDGEGVVLAGLGPDRFAQMLAKIALGYAVAHLGPGGFDPIVQEVIRGGPTKGWGHYVGGDADKEARDSADQSTTHDFHLSNVDGPHGAFHLVHIRLFANLGGPRNYVVVGRTRRLAA